LANLVAFFREKPKPRENFCIFWYTCAGPLTATGHPPKPT
jgi:hypothetical protein